MFSRQRSKRAKRWKPIVVKEKKDYTYMPVLCAKVLKALATGSSHPFKHENDPKKIVPTIAELPSVPTSQLVKEHISRF